MYPGPYIGTYLAAECGAGFVEELRFLRFDFGSGCPCRLGAGGLSEPGHRGYDHGQSADGDRQQCQRTGLYGGDAASAIGQRGSGEYG